VERAQRRDRNGGRGLASAERKMGKVAADQACQRKAAPVASDSAPCPFGEVMNTRILIGGQRDPAAPALGNAHRRHPWIKLLEASFDACCAFAPPGPKDAPSIDT